EHAMGVVESKRGRILCINILTRISKDCDCMTSFEQILPDIGIVVSRHPVAADAASLDLVERKAGGAFSTIAFDIPYRTQIEYAAALGFGSADYELVTV
ncbi:MAG: 4Fe-4S ferredoxin, partial [Spirochaetes bacterium]|nr:4Fe-4S ferredoxin [Spirochaetota bacterium]